MSSRAPLDLGAKARRWLAPGAALDLDSRAASLGAQSTALVEPSTLGRGDPYSETRN